ncbi:Uracil phosphoribosyl transferase [Arabidopsis suecica]|uniref:uracil phosphoribosyltransferase n=1 Tax=Arabidopsis suecica TaxID=45249 RepID=A0A8T2FEB5_ARASU|nr:Uracil phosphoribosyl transferase [Arabidopsis suecica]
MACSIGNAFRCSSDTLRFAPRQQCSSRLNPIPSSFLSFNSSPILAQNLGASSSSLSRRTIRARTKMAASEASINGSNRMLVFVPPHPLIKHWISVLRNEQTPCPVFRNAIAELGRLLMYEASREWLPTVVGEIMSPMGPASVEFIDPREPIAVVPILRAGLALAEHASSVLPANKIYHLGVSRDEKTLLPSVYLNKLPDEFPKNSRVFLVDPVLATGGTIMAAMDLLKERGLSVQQIKVICAIAAPPALSKLNEKFPGLHVYAGIIDPEVNEKGYIIPGLGDAGDRSFGTETHWVK